MMAELCRHDSFVSEKLSRFKAVCIVLHDPDDKSFARRMGRLFDSLHRRTGRDMLFITFTKPTEEFLFRHRDADFHTREQDNLFSEEGTDDSVIIGNFMRAVIPDGDLPSVLVTDDLSSDRFVYLPTSDMTFEMQLLRIADYCAMRPGRFSVADADFLGMLGQMGRPRSVDAGVPLVQALADCLALSEVGSAEDSYFREEAGKWAERTLERLSREAELAAPEDRARKALAVESYRSAMDRMRRKADRRNRPVCDGYETDEDIIIPGYLSEPSCDFDMPKGSFRSLGTTMTGFITAESVERKVKRPPTFKATYGFRTSSIKGFEKCHRISKDDIILYNDVLSRFLPSTHPTQEEMEYIGGGVRRDYMPLAYFFTQFMETEINLSLVQQMRQALGIDMPEWYNRFRPKFTARVRTGEKGKRPVEISLNSDKNRDGVLRSLTLGDAFYAYRAMAAPGAYPGIRGAMGEEFMRNWNTIFSLRNAGNHTPLPTVSGPEGEKYQRLDFGQFVSVHQAFSSILSDDLQTLLRIKTELSGRF